ncbi:MAG: alcohol dehydrogenase, NAD(P)-dependent [Pseudomonadota bacterium]
MLNFNFYNPTQIAFGEGKMSELDQLIPTEARVLILFGGQSAKTHGTIDKVKNALGTRYSEEFGGIEPNPTYETLIKAVAQIKAHHLDFLLAVGGGSVLDGTKFVAAAVYEEGDPWEILLSQGANIKHAVPYGSVLTLPATGSEMNSVAVISRTEYKAKLHFGSKWVFPQFSVLDPTLSYTLPKHQLANGIVDAFTHIAEQYLTYSVDAKVQDRFSEGLLLTLIEIGPELLKNPHDYNLQANFMWTATLALNGLIGAGVPQDWATHMLGHEITALYGLDHAQTLAIILPAMLHERRQGKHEKLLQYAQRVWNITEGSDDERIDLAIEKTRAFFEGLGVKTHLSDYHIGPESVDAIIEQLTSHNMLQLGEKADVTIDVSRHILKAAL